MPFSRLFWKLFATFAALYLIGVVLLGAILATQRKLEIANNFDQRLRSEALLVGDELAATAGSDREDLQRRVERLAETTGTRFSFIATDGKVLADSAKGSRAEVDAMENHRHRPEIMRALAGDEGTTVRESATAGAEYRYFARRALHDGKSVGIVRTGLPSATIAQHVDGAIRRTWTWIAAIGLLGLAATFAGAWILLRPVASLTGAASAIAAGNYDYRVYVESQDELGEIGRIFNRISEDLDQRTSQFAQTSEHHATVLAGMIEGVIAVDDRQRIVLANHAAGRLLEFRPEEVRGRPLMEVLRSHALHQAVTTAMFTHRPQRIETSREGSDRLVADVRVTPLPGDPCPGVVLVLHDTTELRRLENLRRDFVANVSHELKTPLSSIKAYAETLRNGAIGDPEASERFLARIEEQAERLHRLILDMLMIARVESAQQAFEIVSVSVGDVVSACIEDRRQSAEAKQIALSIAPDMAPCSVQADREGLREILDNLIDNAIKYTPEGGSVTVSWQASEGMCLLSVSDTGIGIGPEHRKRVFERFYRVDKARSRELGGTGLGLAIVKHLAQAFGGKVTVDSEPGRGSTFTAHLPTAGVSQPATREAS